MDTPSSYMMAEILGTKLAELRTFKLDKLLPRAGYLVLFVA